MNPAPAILAVALLISSGASAQEVITTGSGGSPPDAEATPSLPPAAGRENDKSPEAIGRWARGVLAGEPANTAADGRPAEARTGCTPPIDRAPHGEVRVGVGTGGYREIGGAVTKPIGDCGRVTIAIDRIEMDGRRRHRR